MQQVQSQCEHCGGKGRIIKHECPVCHGKKLVNGKKTLDVYIEAGMAEGTKIEFEHAADESPDRSAGHIIFKVVQLPNNEFERKGSDLHYTQHISLLESLVGFNKQIKHLDSRMITIQSKDVTPHGHTAKIKSEGTFIYH
jgi:DnaJ-related protein SCJ1